MIIAGGLYFYLSKPKYVSSGTIYVQKTSLLSSLNPIGSDPYGWNSPTQITVNELNELIQTDAFVRAVIQKTDLESQMSEGAEVRGRIMTRLRQSIQVQTGGNNLIDITASDENPQIAQQLANATMNTYTEWKLNGDRQDSAAAQSFFEQIIPGYQQDVQKARNELKAYLEAHPLPLRGERTPQEQVQIVQLQSALDQASKRLDSALEKEESARLAQSQAESNVRQNYLVIDAPTMPLKPETTLRGKVTNAALFFVVGILFSLVGIVGGMLLDRSFRFPLDVHNSLDLPVLAVIPDVTRLPTAAYVSQRSQQQVTSNVLALQQPAELKSDLSETIPVGVPDQASV